MNTTTQTATKQVVNVADLKRMSPGQFSSTATIRIKNPLDEDELIIGTVSILDGIAFGTAVIDGVEREIIAEYPLQQLVNGAAKSMKEKIKTVFNITEERPITVYEILCAYGKFRVIG